MTFLIRFKFKLIVFTIIFYVLYFLISNQTIDNDFFINNAIHCQLAHWKAECIESHQNYQIYNKDFAGSSFTKYEINTREFEDSSGDAGWVEIYIMLGRSNEAH